MKRVLVISDTHCGHQVGLTHPGYKMPAGKQKFGKVRDELWKFFSRGIEKWRPYDVLICNGDMLEGKGMRSGGTELITSDRKTQCELAEAIIDYIGAPVVRMIYGTPSHVGTDEDWEDIIFDRIRDKYNAKIGSHEWFSVYGKIIDCKHKIGSSTVPHGRLTALAREILWNQLWASQGGGQVRADILIRSHDHYFEHTDHQGCLGFITPCLQGYGSKFGSRECSGTIDIGFLIFDIFEDGKIVWAKELIKGKTQIAKAEQL